MRLFSLVTVLPLLAVGQLVPDELIQKFEAMRKVWGVPAVGISVVSKNETQLITLGNATATEPMKDTTPVVFASCTKALTTYAITRLIKKAGIQAGGAPLDWTSRVCDVLPKQDWQLTDKYATEHMTLMDLAMMRSGIPGHDVTLEEIPPRDTVRNLRNLPMKTFRAGYQYSNIGYVVLQYVIEVLSGKPYQDYMQEVFGDWGLSGGTFNLTEGVQRGMPVGHYHTRDASKCKDSVAPNLDPQCLGEVHPLPRWFETDGLGDAASGGAIIPLDQVQHFQRWVLKDPLYAVGIATGASDPYSSEAIYMLGLQQYQYQTALIVGHSGSMPGHLAQMYHAPASGVSVGVFVSDSEWSQFPLAIMYSIFEELIGLEKHDWPALLFNRIKDLPLPPNVEGQGAPVYGKFCHKGYGVLDFQDVNPAVVDLLPAWVSKTSPTEARLPYSLFSHSIVLTAVDPPFYNWTIAMDRFDPPLIGPRSSAGSAVVTNKGIGMFGYFAVGNVELAAPTVDDVENKAEVWFKKC